MTFQNTAICRYSIAGFQHDHVSDYQILTFQEYLTAVPQNFRGGSRHFLQGIHGRFRFAFLYKAEHRVKQDYRENDDHICKFTERRLTAGFNNRDDRLDSGGAQKHEDHGIHQGGEELLYKTVPLGFLKLVFAVPDQTFFGFGGGESLGTGVQIIEYLLAGFKIEFHTDFLHK